MDVTLSNKVQFILNNVETMEKPSSSLEDHLKTYVVDSKAYLNQHDTCLNNIETHCINLGVTVKALETQVS